MIEPFQKFFSRILNIHFGNNSPFRNTKISNPDLQMLKEMGMLQDEVPTVDTDTQPMVVINMSKSPDDGALVTSTVKSDENDDLGECVIKLEPYELQDPVHSKC